MTFSNIIMCRAKKSLEKTLQEMNSAKIGESKQSGESTLYATQPENRHVSPYDEHVKRYTKSTYTEKDTGLFYWLGYIPRWK